LKNAPFCPISASGGTSRQRRGSNFNPRNIQYIPMVKIFAFPRSKSGIFDLTLTKIGHFSKVSYYNDLSLFWEDMKMPWMNLDEVKDGMK
jgi:hypothetical protein